MENKDLKRVHYFTGESLLTNDFQTEQDYFLTLGQYHNEYMHTWGIANGLEVEKTGAVVTVMAGMAVNGEGNEIILLDKQSLTVPDSVNQYFLTVSYQEILTDYTEETLVKGFKRVSCQPKFEFLLDIVDPSMTILLAIIPAGSDTNLSTLEYSDGKNQRHYCGIKVGAVEFHCDVEPPPSIAIQKDSMDAYSLKVDTTTTFTQGVSVSGNVAAGSLLVNAVHMQGLGTISSKDCNVSFDTNLFDPNIKVGDILISTQTPGGQQQAREVTAISSTGITVKTAFNPPLLKSTYLYAATNVLQVSTSTQTNTNNTNPHNLLTITEDGDFQFGDVPGGDALVVDMLINGSINATGNIQATKFIGDGSGLTQVSSVWTQNSNKSIYYDDGNVGIGIPAPTALFQVQGSGVTGSGTVSCNFAQAITVYGNGTKFDQELKKGDMVIVGNAANDEEVIANLPIVLAVEDIDTTSSPQSFTVNMSNSSIPTDLSPLKLVDSTYSIVPSALGAFGTLTQPNIFTISPNGSVSTDGIQNVNSSTIVIDTTYSYTQTSGNMNCVGINVVGGAPPNPASPPQTAGIINCGVLNVGPYSSITNTGYPIPTDVLVPPPTTHTTAAFYGDVYIYGTLYCDDTEQLPKKSAMVSGATPDKTYDASRIEETWGNKNNSSGTATVDGTLVGSIIREEGSMSESCMNLACTVKNSLNSRVANCFAGTLMIANQPQFVSNSFTMPIQKGEDWSVVVDATEDCPYRYCVYFIPL